MKKQKKRALRLPDLYKKTTPHKGMFGLLTTAPETLSLKALTNFVLWSKRYKRKYGTTYWLRTSTNFAVSKKGKGLRMGKGKGKRSGFKLKLAPGVVFLEWTTLKARKNTRFKNYFAVRLSSTIRLVSGKTTLTSPTRSGSFSQPHFYTPIQKSPQSNKRYIPRKFYINLYKKLVKAKQFTLFTYYKDFIKINYYTTDLIYFRKSHGAKRVRNAYFRVDTPRWVSLFYKLSFYGFIKLSVE